jgi:hypothetical protein
MLDSIFYPIRVRYLSMNDIQNASHVTNNTALEDLPTNVFVRFLAPLHQTKRTTPMEFIEWKIMERFHSGKDYAMNIIRTHVCDEVGTFFL